MLESFQLLREVAEVVDVELQSVAEMTDIAFIIATHVYKHNVFLLHHLIHFMRLQMDTCGFIRVYVLYSAEAAVNDLGLIPDIQSFKSWRIHLIYLEVYPLKQGVRLHRIHVFLAL